MSNSSIFMWEKVKNYFLAHLTGLALILIGWYIAVVDSALDRFSQKSLVSGGTITGLVLILVGAYLPEIWMAINNKKK